MSDMFIPFLISRQITYGAGKVVATAHGATFAVSQRADHIWEGVSSATTRSRPIINTRDEPRRAESTGASTSSSGTPTCRRPPTSSRWAARTSSCA